MAHSVDNHAQSVDNHAQSGLQGVRRKNERETKTDRQPQQPPERHIAICNLAEW